MTSAIADVCVLPAEQRISTYRDPKIQTTLKDSIHLSGVGLHSGEKTHLTIRPARSGSGIVFTNGNVIVPALAKYVVDTSRGTTIGLDGVCFRTIEHVLGALSGLGVDNALIEMSGSETPAMDGSALQLAQMIESAGMIELGDTRKSINLTEPVCVRSGDSFILAVPADEFRMTYVLRYDHPLIGAQSLTYVLSEDNFSREIAPSRTFVLYEEVAALLDMQLARGGSIDNVIVFWQDHTSSELRFPDELVRHKMLDMIGDFSLLGGRLNAEVLAVRSGHRLNVEFAKAVTAL
jgi:UDP-3-O-[3-hydroxymyristoyl] N-acetylglucosamine deacetylase